VDSNSRVEVSLYVSNLDLDPADIPFITNPSSSTRASGRSTTPEQLAVDDTIQLFHKRTSSRNDGLQDQYLRDRCVADIG
jgi:hypothetical protein